MAVTFLFCFLNFPSPVPTGMVVLVLLLSVYIESWAVLPLSPTYAYPTRRHPVFPYAAVGGPHHCDGNPTPDISACPGVVFPPLGGEADWQEFQRFLRIIITHIFDFPMERNNLTKEQLSNKTPNIFLQHYKIFY